MAQKMIDLRNLNLLNKNKFEKTNLVIYLSKSKNLTVRFSKNYRDLVISIDINRSKKMILTRNMWKILHENSDKINQQFTK